MAMRFGEFLRSRRLEAGLGLRVFAMKARMQPSNLSNIEHGRIPPPVDKRILDRLADLLGLQGGSEARAKFFDLAVEGRGRPAADVAEFAAKTPGIPMLLRTIEDKRLSEEELRRLMEYIERIRRPAK